MNNAIDIVITYVTDIDDNWCASYNRYKQEEIKKGIQPASNKQAFGKERTRDWEFLPYWFRCVEKNCPWVRYIWFVCQSETQVPIWLNREHPKLKIIYHDQFIPAKFLPTFNPMVIKTFFFKIKGLATNFIESSDDMFFIGQIPEDMFFEDNRPVDSPIIKQFMHKNVNNTAFDQIIINKDNFLHEIYNADHKYYFHHLPLARNSDFEKQFYSKHKQKIDEALSISKFRHAKNLIWHMYTDAMKFEGFAKTKPIFNKSICYQLSGSHFNTNNLNNKNIAVINDTEFITDFNKLKYEVLNWFYKHFTNKSLFELTDTCKASLDKITKLVNTTEKKPENQTKNMPTKKEKETKSNTYLYF